MLCSGIRGKEGHAKNPILTAVSEMKYLQIRLHHPTPSFHLGSVSSWTGPEIWNFAR